jgi:hypothetical protein
MAAPETVESIASEQGWSDETLLLLVRGFVGARGLYAPLMAHLRVCADEENAQSEVFARLDHEAAR